MQMLHLFLLAIAFAQVCDAFVAPSKSFTYSRPMTVEPTSTDLHMMVPDASMATSVVDSMSTLTVSEVEAWVQPLSIVLGPFLNIFSFAMVCIVCQPFRLLRVQALFIAAPAQFWFHSSDVPTKSTTTSLVVKWWCQKSLCTP